MSTDVPVPPTDKAGSQLIDPTEIALANVFQEELEWFDRQDWDGINRSEYNSVLARHLAMHVAGVATHNTPSENEIYGVVHDAIQSTAVDKKIELVDRYTIALEVTRAVLALLVPTSKETK